MSERMTSVSLPGTQAGWANYGRTGIADMIADLRKYAERQIADAQAVLAASDHEFQVETYVGPYAQRKRECLQKSSRLP